MRKAVRWMRTEITSRSPLTFWKNVDSGPDSCNTRFLWIYWSEIVKIILLAGNIGSSIWKMSPQRIIWSRNQLSNDYYHFWVSKTAIFMILVYLYKWHMCPSSYKSCTAYIYIYIYTQMWLRDYLLLLLLMFVYVLGIRRGFQPHNMILIHQNHENSCFWRSEMIIIIW